MIQIKYVNKGIYFEYKLGLKYVGFCLVSTDDVKCKLENIEIKPYFRNKKHGSYLMKFILNYLKYKKYKYIYGNIVPENKNKLKNLIKWYKNHNFNIIVNKYNIIIYFQLNKYIK